MRQFLQKTGGAIRKIVDFFYPPFQKYMPVEFFRYGVTGAANLLFDWVLFFCFFHFVFQKQMLHLGFVTLSSYVAALLFTFPISFSSGFFLQKYVTFSASRLAGKEQIVRYALVVLLNLMINYFGLKLFVEIFGWFPTPSKMLITLVAVLVSYISQKKFTFK